jgi:hypothetical protein
MNKSASKKSAQVPFHAIQPSRRVIQLDQSQYELYLKGQIQIYSPDALLLATIGIPVTERQQAEQRTQLVDNLSLLECLVVNTNGQLELTDRATAALAGLLRDAQCAIE